jgi:hypothetical protein
LAASTAVTLLPCNWALIGRYEPPTRPLTFVTMSCNFVVALIVTTTSLPVIATVHASVPDTAPVWMATV